LSDGLPLQKIQNPADNKPMLSYRSRKHFLRTYAIIFLAATVAFVIRLAKINYFSAGTNLLLFCITLALSSVFWETLRAIHYWLNRVYPFERNLTGRITIQVTLGIIVGILVRAFIYVWLEPLAPFKVDSMFLATTWAIYAMIPVGINLCFFTVYFIDRWKDSIIKTERLEKEKSQVQFDNLKNQLNPHFLFNALTSLNSLIYENQKLASDFLQQLSKVYRYVLQNKDKNFVLLSTELEFIRHYVKLLETRFSSAIRITVDVPSDAREKAIVPVTLQILIENALKHNVVDKNKVLHIEIITIGDYLVVTNNLQPRSNVENSNKLGLENLKSLYRFLTDKPVIIEPTDDRFSVKVPLL
jgi:two-component system, LytTR family, sensor kinase